MANFPFTNISGLVEKIDFSVFIKHNQEFWSRRHFCTFSTHRGRWGKVKQYCLEVHFTKKLALQVVIPESDLQLLIQFKNGCHRLVTYVIQVVSLSYTK
jgi:hypothetical protein